MSDKMIGFGRPLTGQPDLAVPATPLRVDGPTGFDQAQRANIYQIGNELFRDLRAFLGAAEIDPSSCKLVIAMPSAVERDALVARLQQDSLPASPRSGARLGNTGGRWQGVEYEFGVAK